MITSKWNMCYATLTELSAVRRAFQKKKNNKQIASGYYHRDSFTKKPLKSIPIHHIQKFPIYGTPLFANFSVFSLVAGHNKDEWYSAKIWAKIGWQSCFRT